MARLRRVTASLPADLLEDAMRVTDKGIPETLGTGLQLVRRSRAHQKAMALRGRARLAVDLDESRERSRR